MVGKTKQTALMTQSNGCGWLRHSLSDYKERLLGLTLSQGDPTLASFPNVAALGPRSNESHEHSFLEFLCGKRW